MSLPLTSLDLQATPPAIALAIDDVGITGVVRGIVLGGDALPLTATFDVGASLPASSRGAHMSRFHESIDHAMSLVGSDGWHVPSMELLAGVIALRAAELQDAPTARATVRGTIAAPRVTPSSGRRTIDPFDLWATVEVDRTSTTTRTLVTLGIRVSGMTACPCAQGLVRDLARARMIDDGIDVAIVDRALDLIPGATHNQRSSGELIITVPGDAAVMAIADPLQLAELARASMSAQLHELLKRDDELAVVVAAHDDPRFVEDCVRSLVLSAVTAPCLEHLPPQASITVRQTNHESIHAHDVVSSRSGTFAALREELDEEVRPQP